MTTTIGALAAAAVTLSAASAAPQDQHPGVAGVWVLNREMSPAWEGEPNQLPRAPEAAAWPASRAPWDEGRSATPRRRNAADSRKARIARDRLSDVVDRFSIAIDGKTVAIVDGIGRVTRLRADARKQQRVTGDGEFKSTTRLDADRLIVEEDFGGLTIVTRYEPLLTDGTRRLRVTVSVDGLRQYRFGQAHGRQELPPRIAVYDADPSVPVQPAHP